MFLQSHISVLRLPSWELTYPLLLAFWRWFSFSPGEICYIVPWRVRQGGLNRNVSCRSIYGEWSKIGETVQAAKHTKSSRAGRAPKRISNDCEGFPFSIKGLHCRLRGRITFVWVCICIYILYNVYIDSVSAHKFPLRDLWSQIISWKFQTKSRVNVFCDIQI